MPTPKEATTTIIESEDNIQLTLQKQPSQLYWQNNKMYVSNRPSFYFHEIDKNAVHLYKLIYLNSTLNPIGWHIIHLFSPQMWSCVGESNHRGVPYYPQLLACEL